MPCLRPVKNGCLVNICIYYAHQMCEIYRVLPYSVDFKAPMELWNPWSKTVLGKCSYVVMLKATFMSDLLIFFLIFNTVRISFLCFCHHDTVSILNNQCIGYSVLTVCIIFLCYERPWHEEVWLYYELLIRCHPVIPRSAFFSQNNGSLFSIGLPGRQFIRFQIKIRQLFVNRLEENKFENVA